MVMMWDIDIRTSKVSSMYQIWFEVHGRYRRIAILANISRYAQLG